MGKVALLLLLLTPAITCGEEVLAACVDYASKQQEPEFVRFVYGASNEGEAGVLSFTLNSISFSSRISYPVQIGKPEWGLFAFDVRSYAHNESVWRNEWNRLEDGHAYTRVRTAVEVDGKRSVQVVDGVWVDAGMVAELRSRTGASVLRFDYFVSHALSTSYYTFTGMGTNNLEWYGRVGLVDLSLPKQLGARRGASLLQSGVTRKSRRTIRLGSILGGSWSTFDSTDENELPDRDHLRTPISPDGSFRLDYDASELIQPLPNKLPSYYIADGDGTRAEVVPDTVARDTTSPDGILRPAISCMRCHVQGLIEFEDDFDRLGLAVEGTQEVNQAVAEFYDWPTLQSELRRDIAVYNQAIQKASGMEPAALTAALSKVYSYYVYETIDLTDAANELGVEPEQLSDMLEGSNDPILIAIRSGRAVKRKQWEASFGTAASLIHAKGVQ